MSSQLCLISAYDGREELGQWLTDSNTNSQPSPYRSLTGLPQEEQGLPYTLMLHQQLFEPNRPELHAAGNKGADTRHLYLYGDHQNSTVQVRDQDSREAMRLGYSPFGQTYRKHNDKTFWKLNSGVNANNQLNALMPYQYTGRYTEAATGLVHLDARWYNPHTQRFEQPDLWNFRNTGLPSEIQHELMRFTGLDTEQLLRDPSQQVAYGYVSGNPLAWTDWLGFAKNWDEDEIVGLINSTETGAVIVPLIPSSVAWEASPNREGTSAIYSTSQNKIFIPEEYTSLEAAPAAAHEIYHAIMDSERESTGSQMNRDDILTEEVTAKNIGLNVWNELGQPSTPYSATYEYSDKLRTENQEAHDQFWYEKYDESYKGRFEDRHDYILEIDC